MVKFKNNFEIDVFFYSKFEDFLMFIYLVLNKNMEYFWEISNGNVYV